MTRLTTTVSGHNRMSSEEGVTNLLEYVFVSGTLLMLIIVMMFVVNAVFMEGPANTLSYHTFTDIGNGVSTRIVDLYIIAPRDGVIVTKFDLPDEVAGRDYSVEALYAEEKQQIRVRRGDIYSLTAIAGIGATKGVTGNTTGRGWNRICFDSTGTFTRCDQ
jgi:hypothetical protein